MSKQNINDLAVFSGEPGFQAKLYVSQLHIVNYLRVK